MTTEKQIAANQRNAQKSTGPRTDRGKSFARHNAIKHGILAREALINHPVYGESSDEFLTLLRDLLADRAPEGQLEELLVQQVALCYWRLRRIVRADSREFARSLERLQVPAQLLASQGQTDVVLLPDLPAATTLDTILRYERSILSQLSRSLTQLDRLQARRRDVPVPPTLTLQLPDA